MKMKKRLICILAALFGLVGKSLATIEIQATYTDKNGTEVVATESIDTEAPLHVHFTYTSAGVDPGASYEWHIRNTVAGIDITRYDETVDYDFTVAGTTVVTVQATLDGDVVDQATLTVKISDSVLEMPNAFSPNGDGINDHYQAKSTSRSIVEFHAYIFNRYGQKLFDWTDWTNQDSGWDGTYKGHPVKDGVYFVYVKARGADGREYDIRRDVNLLRNHNLPETTNP